VVISGQMMKQRAVLAEDKEKRHDAILDAAARLLTRAPERVANVAEVADEAGLAKGTVYLYFPGKEALLMALHERNVGAFFQALIARLDSAAPLTIGEVLDVVRRHMIEPPLFLPLASRCFGVMQQEIEPAIMLAFKQRMAGRLQQAGAGLERHFGGLEPGGGVALLRHSYALVLGLWQMSPSSKEPAKRNGTDAATSPPMRDDLDRALAALWRGTLASTPA
jgi:AcrR family transcriptional regulator